MRVGRVGGVLLVWFGRSEWRSPRGEGSAVESGGERGFFDLSFLSDFLFLFLFFFI